MESAGIKMVDLDVFSRSQRSFSEINFKYLFLRTFILFFNTCQRQSYLFYELYSIFNTIFMYVILFIYIYVFLAPLTIYFKEVRYQV